MRELGWLRAAAAQVGPATLSLAGAGNGLLTLVEGCLASRRVWSRAAILLSRLPVRMRVAANATSPNLKVNGCLACVSVPCCRTSTAGSVGPSRMGPAGGGSSSSSQCFAAHAEQVSGGRDWQQHQQLSATGHSSSAALMACASGQQHCADTGFQLHSRLSHIDDERDSSSSRVAERRRSFGGGLLAHQQRRWGEQERGGAADCWAQRTSMQTLTGGVGWCAAGDADDSLAWYEAQMQEVSIRCERWLCGASYCAPACRGA